MPLRLLGAAVARPVNEQGERPIRIQSRAYSFVAAVLASFILIAVSSAKAEKTRCANQPTSAVKACIWQAAKQYGQSYGVALRVANCESTFNPLANRYSSNPNKGLFQFNVENTWGDSRSPYRNRSVYSAKWNALAAMWFWSHGEKGRWSCQ